MSETEFDRKMKQAGKDVRDNVDRGAGVASDIGHKVGEAASDAGAAFRDASRKAGNAAADVGHEVMERGQRMGRGVAEHVESQPLSSAIIAGAAGFVVGVLLARR